MQVAFASGGATLSVCVDHDEDSNRNSGMGPVLEGEDCGYGRVQYLKDHWSQLPPTTDRPNRVVKVEYRLPSNPHSALVIAAGHPAIFGAPMVI